VDVSRPASPQEISLLYLQYAAIDTVLCDSIAYIGDFAYHLFSIIDVADPARMQHVGEFQLSRRKDVRYHSRGMDVSGSLLYVIDRDDLDIIDVSPPSLPREVGFYANPLWTGEELEAVEDAQQGSITGISGIEDILPDGFQNVVASGQQVYIPAGTSGLRVLDVSDPASPQEVAQLDIPEFAYQATIADNLLYLLGVEMVDRSILHTIYIIDIAEPENPVIAGSVKDIWGMPPYQSVIAVGKYIYFINLRTVQVIDIYSSDEGV
jgi:hypothetical protein